MSEPGDLQFYMLMLDEAERRLRAAQRAVHKMKDEVKFYQRKIADGLRADASESK